jgi:phenylpropionate dioxygenase-like ring-hydroxylating dioxygenase large terminal subunit
VDFGRLPEPPSYFACTTGGLPVVVTRDTEGDLRAFLNVCRHRGSQVVSGAGCGGVVFRERVHHAVDANWKIAVENYLECYHCPVAHPDFSALVDVDPDAYVLEESGEVWSLYGSARDGDGSCAFHLVWPGLKINVYPGPANLSIGPVWPESPRRTIGFSTTSSRTTSTKRVLGS